MGEVSQAFWKGDVELSRRLHCEGEPVEEAHYVQRKQRYYYKASMGYVLAVLWCGCLFYPNSPSFLYQDVAGMNLLISGTLYIGQYLHYYLRLTYYNQELAREKWETENYLHGEIREMVDLYITRHQFQRIDAEVIITTMSRYPTFFIDHMMNVELNMSNANLKPPFQEALYPSVSFLLFSFIFSIPFGFNTLWKHSALYLLSLQLVFPTVVYLTYFRGQGCKIGLVCIWFSVIASIVILLAR